MELRFEFEGTTGREYELRTDGGDGFISEVTAWTFMPNLWIDVPLHPPIAWMFGWQAGVGLGYELTQ